MPCINTATCKQNKVCSPLQKRSGSPCSGTISEIENCTVLKKNVGRW